MVIGPRFVIGHIGKTAGDAIKQLLQTLRLPGVGSFPIESPRKHWTFRQWGGDLAGRELALSFRRLPAFLLSQFHHRHLDGRLSEPPSAEQMCQDYAADFYLRLYTDEGRLRIDHWLRSETIREDLLVFLNRHVALTEEQQAAIRSAPTKSSLPYNHDWRAVFQADHLRSMYQRNPLWADVEQRVYGSLLRE